MPGLPHNCVVVLGSLNVDTVCRLKALPMPGQTALATSAETHWGGKGANQAVAAARFGARVQLVGALGDDDAGRRYRRQLAEEDVGLEAVVSLPDVRSGAAYVYVDQRGENMIVVDAGANGHLRSADLGLGFQMVLGSAGVLLASLEIPRSVVALAMDLARQAGVHTILNVSPFSSEDTWPGWQVDTAIVNADECMHLFGMAPDELAQLADVPRKVLLNSRNIKRAVITRGDKQTIMLSLDETLSIPSHPVRPVDTVGAGDTFAGVLAAQMTTPGSDWAKAIAMANTAAALSTLKPGAQSAMPRRVEVFAALRASKEASAV